MTGRMDKVPRVHFCVFRGRMHDGNQRSLGGVVSLLLTAVAMGSALAQGPVNPPRSVTMAKDIFDAMVRAMTAESEVQQDRSGLIWRDG